MNFERIQYFSLNKKILYWEATDAFPLQGRSGGLDAVTRKPVYKGKDRTAAWKHDFFPSQWDTGKVIELWLQQTQTGCVCAPLKSFQDKIHFP